MFSTNKTLIIYSIVSVSAPSYIAAESGFSVFFGFNRGIIMVACGYSATCFVLFVFFFLFLELGFLYQMLMGFG